MQLLGTEVARNVFHENFWLYALEKKLSTLGGKQNVVVTDVRFSNELKWLKNKKGVSIEIRRGKIPYWYTIAAEANNGSKDAEKYMLEKSGIHESEWRWIGNPVDFTIDNDGSIDDLRQKIKRCLTNYLNFDTMKEVTNRSL